MFARLRDALAHAFSTAPEALSPDDEKFLEDVARRVAERRMVVPAMLAADLVKHTPGLHMLFFGAVPLAEPFACLMSLGILKSGEELHRLVRLSERREHVEALIRKIEAAASA